MMMPANFSAVSENEMTYVMGGSVADYLAPVMGKKEWSNFSKNLVTIIGNSYLNNFVASTVGTIFNGTYTPGDVLGNFGSDIAGVWGNNYSAKDGKTKFLTGAKGVLNVGLYPGQHHRAAQQAVQHRIPPAQPGKAARSGHAVAHRHHPAAGGYLI